MPGLRDDGPTYRGSLWSRTGSPVWQSVFCKLHKQQLVVFESESAEQAGTPLQTLELQDGQVAEISLKSAGRQMYERALRLKAFTQREEGSSDESSETPSPPASEHILAAEDGITHAAWHRHLLRAVAGCSVAEPLSDKAVSASQQRKRAQATSLFGPSPLVVMRLCCAGREFGKQLLQRLKHARRSFEEGLRDLTVVADKARLAQRGLYDVDSLLLTISRALADSHCADAQSSETDAEALAWCCEWVSGLQAFVMNLDHQVDTMLQREAAAQLPGNWCTFAQNSVMQIRDIEDVMQEGQSQWRKVHGGQAAGALRARCCTTPRSRMPYSAHWARATAI